MLPAECNLTGDQIPLQRIVAAISAGTHPMLVNDGSAAVSGSAAHHASRAAHHGDRWWVMLDAAKAAATSPLDLPSTGAAMACVSLYKLFGEPTGIGALLVRTDLAPLLRRGGDHTYFGGGSVATVLAAEDFHIPKPSIVSALSSGTAHYRAALSVPCGFEALGRLGGMAAVEAHTAALAEELVHRLKALRHANGCAVVELYGAHGADEPARTAAESGTDGEGDSTAPGAELTSGPTVAFNIRRHGGEVVGYSEVIKLAALHTPPIQLRGGCCCNPGACQRALRLSAEDVRTAAAAGKQCGDDFDLLEDGRPTGVVRASLGKDSLWEDVDALLGFIESTYVAGLALEALAHTELNSAAASAGGGGSGAAAAADRAAPSSMSARLGSVFVYPIKSCAAQEVSSWWVERGSGRLLLDREWALLDGRGVVMRLALYPKLALIRPVVDLEAGTLTLSAEGMAPLVLLLGGDGAAKAGGGGECGGADGRALCGIDGAPSPAPFSYPSSDRRVNVCGKDCSARAFGGEAAASWLSKALGVHCRMVRYGGGAPGGGANGGGSHGGSGGGGNDRGRSRSTSPSGEESGSGGERDKHYGHSGDGSDGRDASASSAADAIGVAFANEAPILLLAQAAVDTLNATLRASGEQPVSARHFRPNMVLLDEQQQSPSAASRGLLRGLNGCAAKGGAAATASAGADATSTDDASWSHVELAGGELTLAVTGPCGRCSMVEIDPTSGARHGAVLRALAKKNRVGARLVFGVFCALAPEEEPGTGASDSSALVELRAGSAVTVYS